MRPLWIIGSGGHAKVAIDTARSTGEFDVIGCLDDDPGRLGQTILGVAVCGPVNEESFRKHRIDKAIIAIGSNAARQTIATTFANRLAWATIVHARAYVAESVALGAGSLVCAGAVIQPDVRIGSHAIVNTSASIDHDSTLGDFTHIAPGAHLAGNVEVGNGTFVGLGSNVIPGRRVGAWTIVGAGAAVTKDLPANVTAVGAPAAVIEQRNPGWHFG